MLLTPGPGLGPGPTAQGHRGDAETGERRTLTNTHSRILTPREGLTAGCGPPSELSSLTQWGVGKMRGEHGGRGNLAEAVGG